LIYVDHRGTGRSSRPPLETCTIEQMADDLEALRQYLGLGKVSVMGNSFGGMWGQVYALRHPEALSRLILISTTPSYDFLVAANQELERKGTPEQKATMPTIFSGTVTTDEQFKRWWDVMLPLYFAHWDAERGQQMIERGVDNPLVAAYMFEHIIPHYDVRPHLASITAPTLILAGRHDWVTPVGESEQIAALIPTNQFVIFEESGHMPFIEEQSLFVDTVRAFLAAHPVA
jgi:proline iminopeptidase